MRSRFDDAYNCLISTRYTASATPTVATEKLADHADAWLGWTLTNTPTSSSTVPIQSEMPGFGRGVSGRCDLAQKHAEPRNEETASH